MPALGFETEVGKRLADRGLTLAAAESCTGGLLSHRITMVPGSSRYFLGSCVTYSNGAKAAVLGIDPDLIARHGAVSEPVAAAMAGGARRVFGADLAVGITGVAGPGGGSPSKPVGHVCIAVETPDGAAVRAYRFFGDRLNIKEQSCRAALNMLREWLDQKTPPRQPEPPGPPGA